MIVRIVRLSFEPSKVESFLEIFESSKDLILAFEGCTYLSLMKDHTQNNIYYTVSNWQDGTTLENYRQSALFKNTWAKTKALFNDKAIAWSLDPLQTSGLWLYH